MHPHLSTVEIAVLTYCQIARFDNVRQRVQEVIQPETAGEISAWLEVFLVADRAIGTDIIVR